MQLLLRQGLPKCASKHAAVPDTVAVFLSLGPGVVHWRRPPGGYLCPYCGVLLPLLWHPPQLLQNADTKTRPHGYLLEEAPVRWQSRLLWCCLLVACCCIHSASLLAAQAVHCSSIRCCYGLILSRFQALGPCWLLSKSVSITAGQPIQAQSLDTLDLSSRQTLTSGINTSAPRCIPQLRGCWEASAAASCCAAANVKLLVDSGCMDTWVIGRNMAPLPVHDLHTASADATQACQAITWWTLCSL